MFKVYLSQNKFSVCLVDILTNFNTKLYWPYYKKTLPKLLLKTSMNNFCLKYNTKNKKQIKSLTHSVLNIKSSDFVLIVRKHQVL